MKTVIIIGAGTTRASGVNKSRGKIPPLDPDFFEIAKYGYYPKYYEIFQCIESLVGDYSSAYLNLSNWQLLTYT